MLVLRWGENDIFMFYYQFLFFYCGKIVRFFDDEFQGKGYVFVSRGGFFWQDELKIGVDGVGGVGCLYGRVYQYEYMMFCFFC